MDFLDQDPAADSEISEDSLRLALEKLGGKAPRRQATNGPQRAVSDQRRRRFVQDGQVVVEHQPVSRTTSRSGGTAQNDDYQEEVKRLRNVLKLEQRRADDLQRELNDLQVQHRTAETHLVHEKLRVAELKASHDETQKALLAARSEAEQLKDECARLNRQLGSVQISVPVPPLMTPPAVRKPRAQVRVDAPPRENSERGEPEPVRWWKD